MKYEINATTQEEIVRELNDDEIKQDLLDRKKAEDQMKIDLKETQAKAAEKAALLERLGINEDEAKLLLS